MKNFLRVLGALLIIAAIVWIVFVMVEVFRHNITSMGSGEFWGAVVFHGVAMILGLICLWRAAKMGSPAEAPAESPTEEK